MAASTSIKNEVGRNINGWHDAAVDNPYDRPAPVYVGFAEAEPDDLYEFVTDAGEYVFLHELNCVDIRYRPPTRRLTVTFEGGPTELVPAMSVTLEFEEAEIYQWQSRDDWASHSSFEPGQNHRGMVGDLGTMTDGPGSKLRGASFHLSLRDIWLSFFATVVTCRVRNPAAPSSE